MYQVVRQTTENNTSDIYLSMKRTDKKFLKQKDNRVTAIDQLNENLNEKANFEYNANDTNVEESSNSKVKSDNVNRKAKIKNSFEEKNEIISLLKHGDF